ncbi:thioredoxin [Treponema berlinense]|uniref:thioredoxin n=1 Tax=Treponema berlinense TaxID=225004 RepID=UPI0034E93239
MRKKTGQTHYGRYFMEITLTKENFETEVLKSELPVLVDFWASWCGPCKMLAPTVAQIAEEYSGKVKVGKVNVDEQDELSREYGIVSIPTVILFKNGQPVKTSVGLVPKETLTAMFS